MRSQQTSKVGNTWITLSIKTPKADLLRRSPSPCSKRLWLAPGHTLYETPSCLRSRRRWYWGLPWKSTSIYAHRTLLLRVNKRFKLRADWNCTYLNNRSATRTVTRLLTQIMDGIFYANVTFSSRVFWLVIGWAHFKQWSVYESMEEGKWESRWCLMERIAQRHNLASWQIY